MDSLIDVIGIEGEGLPTGSSGLFINRDTPLTLEQFQKIKEADQPTLADLWSDIQKRAIAKFVIQVKAGYRELFGICDVEDSWFDENKTDLAHALLFFLGMEVCIEIMYSTRINRFT
jgi:hypothetical protein